MAGSHHGMERTDQRNQSPVWMMNNDLKKNPSSNQSKTKNFADCCKSDGFHNSRPNSWTKGLTGVAGHHMDLGT
eukprot:scaffold471454_cov20-Prasinocladus_malaysianus.AAC.1